MRWDLDLTESLQPTDFQMMRMFVGRYRLITKDTFLGTELRFDRSTDDSSGKDEGEYCEEIGFYGVKLNFWYLDALQLDWETC
jgi:hypothetical protein